MRRSGMRAAALRMCAVAMCAMAVVGCADAADVDGGVGREGPAEVAVPGWVQQPDAGQPSGALGGAAGPSDGGRDTSQQQDRPASEPPPQAGLPAAPGLPAPPGLPSLPSAPGPGTSPPPQPPSSDLPPPRAPPDTDDDGPFDVVFLDVGQADAALVRDDDTTVLIDTGHWQRPTEVADHLDRLDVDRIDVLVLTHWHADHIGGTADVLATVDVGEVWGSPATTSTATYTRTIDAIETSGADFRTPVLGDSTTVGGLQVEAVGPLPDADLSDLHDAGVSVRVGNSVGAALFTGDAEAGTEQRYVDAAADLLDADVLQVGHHGSYTSTTQPFLDAVGPQVAVISVGAGNPYGHPHDGPLARLEAAGVEVWRTDRHGTVVVSVDRTAVSVAPQRR